MNEWNERVVVVTGAGGAMGTALTRRLREEGARVAALDLPSALEDEIFRSEGCLALAVDAGDRGTIADAYRQIDERWGRVDHAVHLAAINSKPLDIEEIPEEEFHRVIDINVGGTFWSCQEAARRMKAAGKGSIVNISSLNGFMGRMQFPTHVYATSKAAVIGLTRSLAAELGPHGIRVNCIAPGLHHSAMSRAVADSEEGTELFFRNAIQSTPLRRIAEGAEMAGPIMFLLSDAAGYITGQLISHDGGRSTWYQ